MTPQESGALHGVRVLEFSHAIAGPHCGQILADRGADVIKIEPPTGDFSRAARPIIDGDSAYFASHNRGKRSVVLDLKTAEDTEILHRIIGTADVLLTNYAADVPAKLGWDYEQLKEKFPRLIFVHVTGFGRTGADRDKRAYDGIIQSMSGIPATSGEPGASPTLTSAFLADHYAAMNAALGTMFALRRRELTGEGGLVDISMMDAYGSTTAHFSAAALAGQEPKRTGNRVPTAFANTFRTADGAVYLAPLGDDKWIAFCRLIDRVDWAESLPYRRMVDQHRDEADAYVASWCAARTSAQIAELMDAHAIPCGPVLTVAEYAAHAVANGATISVTSPEGREYVVPRPVAGDLGLARTERSTRVPALGADTAEVLGSVGDLTGLR